MRRGVLTRRQLYRVLQVAHAHGWRIGDAAVVLRLALRPLIEAEAMIFELHYRGDEHRRRPLEAMIDQIERERAEARHRAQVQLLVGEAPKCSFL